METPQRRESTQEKINAIYEWETRHPLITSLAFLTINGAILYYLYRHNHFGEMVNTATGLIDQGKRIIHTIASGSINFPSLIR